MLVPIEDADDPRIEAYRDIRERDLKGRGGRFIIEGEVVLRTAVSRGRFGLESILIGESRLGPLAERIGPGRTIVAGFGIASSVQILLPLADGPPALALTIAATMFFVSGCFMTVGNTNVATLQQMLTLHRQPISRTAFSTSCSLQGRVTRAFSLRG